MLAKLPTTAVFLALTLASPAGAQPDRQAADTMTATVQRVNPQDSTVAVVYGVSLALKVVALSVAPDCQVMLQGRGAALDAVRRGQVVRVRFRGGADGALVAERIEVVRGAEGQP